MKIKNSKYYKNFQLFTVVESDNFPTISVSDSNTKIASSDTPYDTLLSSQMPCISLYNAELVIRKEQLEDFEKCTDFHTVNYNNKSGKLFQSESCYFYPEHELFILTNENLSNEYDKLIIESGMVRVTDVYYNSSNPDSPKNLKNFFDRYLQKYVSSEAKLSILIKESHGFTFKNHKIHPHSINLDTMYNEDFLPVHQKIKHDLTNSNKGVVLLHGLAGSGKTNYIKWLTSQIPHKNFIFVPNSLIQVLVDPSFISTLIEKENPIIVLEDCENYIAERSVDASQTDVVASILNIADGMLSDVLECQFICTFNARLTEIDHALLRKGRLIAEYHFGELSVERCNAYLKANDKNMTVDKPHSLAELVHIDEAEYKVEKADKPRIGF